jgi:hypothetical protein
LASGTRADTAETKLKIKLQFWEVAMQHQMLTLIQSKALNIEPEELTVYPINITPEINTAFISIRICYRRHKKLGRNETISIQIWPVTHLTWLAFYHGGGI